MNHCIELIILYWKDYTEKRLLYCIEKIINKIQSLEIFQNNKLRIMVLKTSRNKDPDRIKCLDL